MEQKNQSYYFNFTVNLCKDGSLCVEINSHFLPSAKRYFFPSSEIKLINMESKEVKWGICIKKKDGWQNFFHSVWSHLGFCKGKSFAKRSLDKIYCHSLFMKLFLLTNFYMCIQKGCKVGFFSADGPQMWNYVPLAAQRMTQYCYYFLTVIEAE